MASQSSKFNTKRIVICAVFSAIAIILSYLEFLFPINIGIPGVKIGLANLVIIVALYEMDIKDTFAINLIRIGVSGALFSGLFGMLYSLSGGMLSLLVMWLLKKTKLFSVVGVSLAGGITHNLGQLIMAAIIMEDWKMFMYFPVLLISGIIAGIALGIAAYFILKKLPRTFFVYQ